MGSHHQVLIEVTRDRAGRSRGARVGRFSGAAGNVGVVTQRCWAPGASQGPGCWDCRGLRARWPGYVAPGGLFGALVNGRAAGAP